MWQWRAPGVRWISGRATHGAGFDGLPLCHVWQGVAAAGVGGAWASDGSHTPVLCGPHSPVQTPLSLSLLPPRHPAPPLTHTYTPAARRPSAPPLLPPGGIFFPLAKALCLACGSDPEKGTAKKIGSYLMLTCFQTTTVSSAMFITAMAANPLAVNLASSAGINISWGTWALAGLVPGLISLVSVPLILYALFPPEVKDTPDAPAAAKKELDKLGPLSLNEKITAGGWWWVGGEVVGGGS